MKRRDFVFSTATFALLTGCGQLPNLGKAASPRVAHVGILTYDATTNSTNAPTIAGLKQGLAALGYVDGQTIAFELGDAAGNIERLPELASELVHLPVDVLACISSPAVVAAQQATTVVPIVFASVSDAVGKGFVASLDHPGGNITGVPGAPVTVFGKMIQYLTQLVPGLSRVAFVTTFDSTSGPGGAQGPSGIQLTTTAANALGIQLKFLNVRTSEDLEPALAEALAWQAEAMMVGGLPITDPTPRFVDFQRRHRIPFAFGTKEQVQTGGLLSYGPSSSGIGSAAAALVDKILKGAKPAELPVEQPTEYELVVNQTTAQALGITIPPEVAQQVTEWVQ
jgi:putative tryptophan/tyrosine transport system substrate-binding protein